MFYQFADGCLFVRIDPGEPLVSSLKSLAAKLSIHAASIMGGVGMLKDVRLGFFDIVKGDYDETTLEGIFDLSSVHGNIMEYDDVPTPHVHVVFNDTSFKTYSGHLIEGECHITIELFLLRLDSSGLIRNKQSYLIEQAGS